MTKHKVGQIIKYDNEDCLITDIQYGAAFVTSLDKAKRYILPLTKEVIVNVEYEVIDETN